MADFKLLARADMTRLLANIGVTDTEQQRFSDQLSLATADERAWMEGVAAESLSRLEANKAAMEKPALRDEGKAPCLQLFLSYTPLAEILARNLPLDEARSLVVLNRFVAARMNPHLAVRLEFPWLPAVRRLLEEMHVAPIGEDQITVLGGLFPGMVCCLTCAHAKARSLMLLRRLGFSHDEAVELLRKWCPNATDALTFKGRGNATLVPEMQRDLKKLVRHMIKIVLEQKEEGKDTLFFMTSWILDLLKQFEFEASKVVCNARVKLDGTNYLRENHVKHGEGALTVHCHMLAASHLGENVFHFRILEAGQHVATATCVVMGHGGGSGTGQHMAHVYLDALGVARAVVGRTMAAASTVSKEDF